MIQQIPCPMSTAEGLGVRVIIDSELVDATGGVPLWAAHTDGVSFVAVQPQANPEDTQLLIWAGIAQVIRRREGQPGFGPGFGELLQRIVAGDFS